MGAPGVTGGLSDRITALSRRPRGTRLRRRARPVVDPATGSPKAAVIGGHMLRWPFDNRDGGTPA